MRVGMTALEAHPHNRVHFTIEALLELRHGFEMFSHSADRVRISLSDPDPAIQSLFLILDLRPPQQN
jgi:hypothetical protein